MTHVIYALSGGTGRTVHQALRTVLPQFFGTLEELESQVEVVRRPEVLDPDQARSIAEEAAERGGLVFHTLFDEAVEMALVRRCRNLGVPCVAVLDPVEKTLAAHLGREPDGRPGRPRALYGGRFDHLDAVDFMLATDDGQGLARIHKADVVLVGPSRVSKSVTCLFLAYLHGLKAANVPLVPDIPIPRELEAVEPGKVVALITSARRLQEIRRSRSRKYTGVPMSDYDSFEACQDEIRRVQRLVTDHGWKRAYVSSRAVEEVVSRVLELVRA